MSTKLKYFFYLDERIKINDVIAWLEDAINKDNADEDYLGKALLDALHIYASDYSD